jgi:DNA invertase Pin-like site-specific DNA recombinase
MKAVIYIRVSTEEQASEGASLAMQEHKCRQYAELHDMEVVSVVADEGVSARDTNRPGLRTVQRMMEVGAVDSLIVLKLDRLTRSVSDLYELLRLCTGSDVGLHGVEDRMDTDSATGRAMLGMLAVLSQWERETISERVVGVLADIRRQGYHVGKAPWGWDAVKHDGPGCLLEPRSTTTVEIIERARAYRNGGLSLRKIADQLFTDGLIDKLMAPTSVQRVLRAPHPDDMILMESGAYRWPATDYAATI